MRYPRIFDLVREWSRARATVLPADGQQYLYEAPTAEWVRRAYQLILGREPESTDAIAGKLLLPNIQALRRELLSSDEFRMILPFSALGSPDPSRSRERLTIAFIHIPKTAGTSIRSLFENRVFDHGRPCVVAPPMGQLYEYPPGTLSAYDIFCGHFDYESLRYLPRNEIRVVTMFRDPVERLISLYRFHHSKIPGAFLQNEGPTAEFAQRLSVEEFFEHPEVRTSSEIFNTYLLTIGRSHAWYASQHESLARSDFDAALEDAEARIRRMAVVGICERYAESVAQICSVLDIERPAVLEVLNATDDLARVDPRCLPAEPVTRTPRLLAALEDLIVYDRKIYEFALGEFTRRQAELPAG